MSQKPRTVPYPKICLKKNGSCFQKFIVKNIVIFQAFLHFGAKKVYTYIPIYI